MAYHHADHFNDRIGQRCACGGEPEMIVDFVDDFIVRCRRCHTATGAYIEPEDAILHWKRGDVSGPPLDLLIDDLDKNLAGRVRYMAIPGEYAEQYEPQSCECDQVMIVMRDRTFIAEHAGVGDWNEIGFDEVDSLNGELFDLRIVPAPGQSFEFVKVRRAGDGSVIGAKYRLGGRYIFIFSSDHGLVVTKSASDLFEEDDVPLPAAGPSALFASE